MDPLGPMITEVNLITGTVFEPNNFGQFSYGLPEYETPGRQPFYFTGTNFGSVPLGVVAWITIDWTGVAPNNYTMRLSNEALGTSTAYDAFGRPGTFENARFVMIPEPSGVALGLMAVVCLGGRSLRRARIARRHP